MINSNSKNDSIRKRNDNDKKSENIKSNTNSNTNNIVDELFDESEELVYSIGEKNNQKEKNAKKIMLYNNEEIKNTKQEKSIFNMILLSSGNIATSSMCKVTIYNKDKLLSSNEEDYILQIINISKSKKVSYVYEFTDKTLLCATYSKIFRLKLTENDTQYNILGIIPLEKLELPSKLISLGNSLLAVLTVIKGKSFIRLFIKSNESQYSNDLSQNNNNNENNELEKYNSDDQSAGILSEYAYNLDKQKIEKDKEFSPYLNDNNINLKKDLLLCSIQEIKMKNYYEHKNEYKYDFIVTSNSIYDYGEDIIIYYSLKNNLNKNFEYKTKVINNISCSAEADSICQLNKNFICVGLQNHEKEGQISGFAIIDVKRKNISRIVKDLAIYSLYYNYEKKLLYAAADMIEKDNKHKFHVIINQVVEGMEEIYLNKIFSFDSKHKDIIVSILEINKEQIKEFEEEDNENNNTIIVSASIDSTLKLINLNERDDK